MHWTCQVCGESYPYSKIDITFVSLNGQVYSLSSCKPDCETRRHLQKCTDVAMGIVFGLSILAIVIAMIINM